MIELECKSWRHGGLAETLGLHVRIDGDADGRGIVEIRVQAENLLEQAVARLPVRIAVEAGNNYEEAVEVVERMVRNAKVDDRL